MKKLRFDFYFKKVSLILEGIMTIDHHDAVNSIILESTVSVYKQLK